MTMHPYIRDGFFEVRKKRFQEMKRWTSFSTGVRVETYAPV